jgi:ankyrin repeat protein
MPKHHKKGETKGKKVDAAIADADDDFDNILAELQASDLTNIIATTITTTTSASSNRRSSSTSSTSSGLPPRAEVTEAMIVQASVRGDVAQLWRWAKRGVRVGSTKPLSGAVLKNHIAAVRCLVKELGADSNQVDDLAGTPLTIAALNGNVRMIRLLVKELGADFKRANKAGDNFLLFAARHGQLAVMRCLVKELCADVNQANNLGSSPLYIAAQEGNLEVVQCLSTELGADVNILTKDGCTPLDIAALSGHLAVVVCLVKDAGADVDRVDARRGSTPLLRAALIGNLEVVQCLVEIGADVNFAAEDGGRPLMIAAQRMQHKVVRYLLKQGADPQVLHDGLGTAADISEYVNAPGEETAYLEARTHCANPGCTNAGLKKCERCLQVYFCGSACIRAHWPAHKTECKAAAANLRAAKGASPSSSSAPSPL